MTDTTTTPPADAPSPPAPGAPPAPPANAAEANAQLRARTSDSKWVERFLAGNGPEVREFNELSAQIASAGDEAADMSGFVTTTNAIADPLAVSPATYNALIGGLREQGLPDSAEVYMRDLDAGVRTDRPSAGDGLVCKQALARLIKSPEWRQRLLAGDIPANNLMGTLSRIVAYSADDGAPASDYVRQQLAALGLR